MLDFKISTLADVSPPYRHNPQQLHHHDLRIQGFKMVVMNGNGSFWEDACKL